MENATISGIMIIHIIAFPILAYINGILLWYGLAGGIIAGYIVLLMASLWESPKNS